VASRPAAVPCSFPFCLHVRDDPDQSRRLRNAQRLFEADAPAEARLGRLPDVIRKVRPPRRGGGDDLHDFLRSCEISGPVLESGGDTPRAHLHRGDDEGAHPLDLLGGWPAIGGSHHCRPDAVETDVGAPIDRETGFGHACCPRTQIDRPGAVRILDLGRHALRQHVLRARERRRLKMAVNVDESRSDVEPGDVDIVLRRVARELSDPRDAAVCDRDIRAIRRQS
jgi:hypothetical protein